MWEGSIDYLILLLRVCLERIKGYLMLRVFWVGDYKISDAQDCLEGELWVAHTESLLGKKLRDT